MISRNSVLLAVTVASLMGCATVDPGHVGLLWTAGGGLRSQTYGEGLHVVAPWNSMNVYDLRTHSSDELLNVISVNGLAIDLAATVRYHVIPNEVVALDEQIGPHYYATVLEPVLRSEARRVIGRYTPEEIYSTKRDVIERETREAVEQKIAHKHIALEAILIRNVVLPQPIREAIDQKLAAEQEVLKMQYVLEVASAKAEERRIEAQGVADYNKLVAASLSPAIIEYEKIQELEGLARSNNAKTVVLGSGATPPQVMLQTRTGQ